MSYKDKLPLQIAFVFCLGMAPYAATVYLANRIPRWWIALLTMGVNIAWDIKAVSLAMHPDRSTSAVATGVHSLGMCAIVVPMMFVLNDALTARSKKR